jgi:hypothetical protein
MLGGANVPREPRFGRVGLSRPFVEFAEKTSDGPF